VPRLLAFMSAFGGAVLSTSQLPAATAAEGILRRKFPGEAGMWLCHESICRAVYLPGG
jgi:hypothetical protein